jgi:hypothetical protein
LQHFAEQQVRLAAIVRKINRPVQAFLCARKVAGVAKSPAFVNKCRRRYDFVASQSQSTD